MIDPTPHGRASDHSEPDSQTIMSAIIRRQRLGLMAGAALLVLLFLLHASGFDLAGTLQGTLGQEPAPVSQETPPKASSDPTPTAAGPDRDGSEDQEEAPQAPSWQRAQSVACVAYPWTERRNELFADLASDHANRWLPTLVDDIGMALTDFNNGLERGNDTLAEQMLRFVGNVLSPEELTIVQAGAETEHLIVVDVSDTETWKVYGWTHGMTLDTAPEVVTLSGEQLTFPVLTSTMTKLMSQLVGMKVKDTSAQNVPAEHARDLARLDALVQAKDVAASLELAATMRFPNPSYVYPLVVLARNLNDHSDHFLHDMKAAINHGVRHPRLVERYAAYITWEDPKPEEYVLARKLLTEVLDEYPTFMPAWSTLERLPEYVDGTIKYPDPEVAALDGMKRFPKDGRYQAGLAAQISVQQYRAEEAVEYAKQAFELAPWRRTVLFHSAMARVQVARKLIRNGTEHYSAARKEYDLAINEFLAGWQVNQNRLELWTREIINAMTLGQGERAPDRWLTRGSFVVPKDRTYRKLLAAFCIVERSLVGGTSRAPENTLNWLKLQEPDTDYEALIREDALKARDDIAFPNRYLTLMAGAVIAMGEVGGDLNEAGVRSVLQAVEACFNAGVRPSALVEVHTNMLAWLEANVSNK